MPDGAFPSIVGHDARKTGVVEVWHIDMLDYTTIKSFVDRANTDLPTVDIAVLNAGVVMASHKESQYGYEQTMQVNVLAYSLPNVQLSLVRTPTRTSLDVNVQIICAGAAAHLDAHDESWVG